MIYFTSDWHIGHNKEFLYKPRGFSSIEEHDIAVLQRCNEIVDYNDELWILGDLAMGGDKKAWNQVYYNLKCHNVHFIQGNHDTDNKMNIYENEYFMNFEGFAQIYKYSKRRTFYLSHYPTIVGNFEDGRPSMWNLSGHTHSKDKFSIYPNVYNVALDAHNCYPVSIEQIYKDILKKEGKI